MTQPSRITCFVVLAAAIAALFAPAATAQWVYATSPDANLVSVIDPSHDTVARTIPTPFSPGAIGVTPDGKFAYVANLCSAADKANSVPGTVTVLDLVNNVVAVPTISVGNCPNGVAVGTTANGVKAYVSNSPGSVSVIDVATNNVSTIQIPPNPATGIVPAAGGVALSPDGSTLYVDGNPIAVINTATNQVSFSSQGGIVSVDPGNTPWFTGGAGLTVGNAFQFFVNCTAGPVAFMPSVGRGFMLDSECGGVYDVTGSALTNTFGIAKTFSLKVRPSNQIAMASDGSQGYVGGELGSASITSASATAVMNGDKVSGVNISSPGSGYVGTPAVQFYSRDQNAIGYTQTGHGPGNPLGSVPWVALSNVGSGYLQPPAVQFLCTDLPGQCPLHPATAVAAISNGSVSSVTVTNGGSGYINPPLVLFIRQNFTPAQGTATVTNGGVASVTVTSPGSGYGQPPAVEFVCGIAPANCGAGVVSFDPGNDSQVASIPLVGADAQGLAIAPTPAPNTSASPTAEMIPLSNVPVTVNFLSGVTQAGFTGAVISTTGPSVQPNFQLSDPSVYYDIFTTATYPAGSLIQVCITAPGVASTSRLVHFVGGSPVDITDASFTPPTICGTTSSLSPFAVEEPTAPTLTSTATGLSVSPNPASAGQLVTFSSGVSAGTGTGTGSGPAPTGSVTLFDGATALGSPVNLPNSGPAMFTISTLAAGTHTITAQYSGDTNYSSSTSPAVILTVSLNAASIGLAISPNPAAAGQSITLSSGVAAATTGGGIPAPTGSVTFLDGGTPIAPAVNLPNSGPAMLTISTLAAGMHTITAQYNGDANYSSSTSLAVTLTINKSGSSIGLSVSPNPSSAGQLVTLTSGVTGSAPTGTGAGTVPPPSGSVTFLDGGTPLGPAVPLPTNNSGPVTFTTSSLTPGVHSITAQYSGDPDYNGSTSSTVQVTITNPATTTSLVSSSSTSVYGQGVIFTATVTSGAGSPGGSVNFFDGSTSLGSGTLDSSGTAMLTTSSLSAGTHSITASYAATGIFLASTSTVLTQTVNAAPLSITINSFSRQYGQTNPPFTGTISGLQNGDNITANYNTIAMPASPVGSYPITATLSDPNGKLADYAVKTSNGTLTITPAPLTIAANNRVKAYGQAVAFAGTEFTTSGLLNPDSVTSVTLTSAGAVATATVAGSPYPITPSNPVGTGLGNYSISYVNGALTVTSASLTVTASSLTKVLDAPNPSPLPWTVTGFVNGENTSVLSASPACITTATTTSPVGGYPITCSGAAAANYTFSYVAGTLKILYAAAVGHIIQPPINADGSSVFKQGRTIPAKFNVYDATGVAIGSPGVVSSFFLTAIVSGTVTTTVENVVDTNNPDTSFRWDGQEWIFNITTANLSAGSTYVYTIVLNDGSTIMFQFGLR